MTVITLTVDGQNVAVDGSGLARVTFSTPGIYPVVATVSDAAGNTRSTSDSLIVASDNPSAPAIAITAPDKDGTAGSDDDGAIVTAPTAVTGSVTDDDLTRYTVTVHTFAGVQLSTIKDEYSGGNVIPAFSGTFGTFDPTVLKNGPYFIRLVAQDIAGHVTQLDRLVNVSSNLKPGNFSISFTDITVPVTGIPVTVTRSYSTLRANEEGDFGYGWKLDIGDYEVAVDRTTAGHGFFTSYPAFKEGTRVVITLEDGTTQGYTFTPWEERRFLGLISVWHPFFTADEGVIGFLGVPDVELTKYGDLFLSNWDGFVSYNPADPKIDSGGESVVYHHYGLDGLKRTIDAKTGKIEKIAESHGNELTISDSGIVSNRGRELAFERDWKNRITKITDPRGNFVSYGYDLVTGDLLTFTNRTGNTTPDPDDYTTTFSYLSSPAHFLDKIVDPLGRETAALAFDSENRLAVLTDAQGETINIAYDLTDPAATKTTVTDQLGKQSSTTQDDQGNVIRLDDAEGGITLGTYDDGDRPLTQTRVIGLIDDPTNGENDDLTTELTFGALGLPLTQTIIVGDKDTAANGETDDLETRYTYNSAGQITSETDPLGNTTRYFYAFDSGFDNEEEFNPFTLADLVMTVDPIGNSTLFEYDEQGRLTAITTGTRFDNWTWFDSTDDTDGGTDPGLFAFFGFGTFEFYVPDYDPFDPYDPDADPSDPAANPLRRAGLARIEFAYNTFGDLTATTDTYGTTRSSSFDANGNQTGTTFTWVNPNDATDTRTITTSAVIDPEDRVTDSVSPTGTTTTEYDFLGRPFRTTDRFSGVSESKYDSRGSAIEFSSPEGTISRTVYDQRGRAVWTTDSHLPGQSTNGTKTIYDNLDRVVATERYANVVIDLVTQADGSLKSVFTSSNATPFSTTSTVYDDSGRVQSSTDADGHVTNFEYDEADRQTAIVDVVNGVTRRTEFEYDMAGRQILARDALGRETKNEYDASGKVVKIIYTDGTIATSDYDLRGRLVAKTAQHDPNDTTTPVLTTEYDIHGNLTAVVLPSVADPEDLDGNGNPIIKRPRYEYEYDVYGNRTKIRDSKSRETTFTYDEHGRQLTRTLPEGQQEEFRYDSIGRQFLHVDFEGRVEEHIYDDSASAGGRLKETRYFDDLTQYSNGAGTPTETVVYTFDAEGRLTQLTDARGTTTFSFDDENRTTRIDAPEGAVNYEYDDATSRITRMFTGPVADPVNDFRYVYDELGRLEKVEVWERNDVVVDSDPGTAGNQPETTTYGFDLVGNLDRVDLPNGVVSDYQYDNLNRLNVLTHYSPDATPQDLSDNAKLAEFDHTVRPDGKRTSVTETRWDSGAPQVTQIDWTYDGLGRLTDEVFNHYDDLLDQTQHFSYDLAGNRLARTLDAGNNGTLDEVFAYTYDNNDRLLTDTKDVAGGTTGDTTTVYEYGGPTNSGTEQTKKTVTDTATGITRSTTSFAYDLQGRMKQVTVDTFDAAGVKTATEWTTFDYDAGGFRISSLHEVDADADGTFETRTLTEFLADKRNPTGYAQTIEERVTDADTGAVLKTTVYTMGLDAVSQTVFTPGGPTDGDTHVFLYDGHGSVRMLANMLATVVESYDFDAYGNAIGFDPAAALTSLLYSGEHYNAAISQQYLRARWYDATTGRFNRVDPFSGFDLVPNTLHDYFYAAADPVNNWDPTGLVNTITVSAGIGMSGILSLSLLNAISAVIVKVAVLACVIVLVAHTAAELAGFELPDGPCAPDIPNQYRMRVQLQKRKTITIPTPTMLGIKPWGVTTAQVRATMAVLFVTPGPQFPNSEMRGLRKAIVNMSIAIKKYHGIGTPGGLKRSLVKFEFGTRGWRLDLDNLSGKNLWI